jgi:hypothetical protein
LDSAGGRRTASTQSAPSLATAASLACRPCTVLGLRGRTPDSLHPKRAKPRDGGQPRVALTTGRRHPDND